jgi:hypothetical protein
MPMTEAEVPVVAVPNDNVALTVLMVLLDFDEFAEEFWVEVVELLASPQTYNVISNRAREQTAILLFILQRPFIIVYLVLLCVSLDNFIVYQPYALSKQIIIAKLTTLWLYKAWIALA